MQNIAVFRKKRAVLCTNLNLADIIIVAKRLDLTEFRKITRFYSLAAIFNAK